MSLTNRLDNVLRLSDGRNLGFATYGAPNGKPVLFFHGIPGSRLQRNPDPGSLAGLDICIYALDRPGIGLSTAHPHRTLLSWTRDVLEFTRQMHFSRFAVAGVSGGGPYALACAWQFPEIITHLSVISGIGPLAEPAVFSLLKPKARRLFRLANNHPKILAPLLSAGFKIFQNRILDAFAWLTGDLPSSDTELLKHSEVEKMFQEDVRQAFHSGSQGVLTEIQVLMQPWGFEPGAIGIPVHVWHGTDDTIVPLTMAEYLIQQFRHPEKHFIPKGGHFTALDQTYTIFAEIARAKND